MEDAVPHRNSEIAPLLADARSLVTMADADGEERLVAGVYNALTSVGFAATGGQRARNSWTVSSGYAVSSQ